MARWASNLAWQGMGCLGSHSTYPRWMLSSSTPFSEIRMFSPGRAVFAGRMSSIKISLISTGVYRVTRRHRCTLFGIMMRFIPLETSPVSTFPKTWVNPPSLNLSIIGRRKGKFSSRSSGLRESKCPSKELPVYHGQADVSTVLMLDPLSPEMGIKVTSG